MKFVNLYVCVIVSSQKIKILLSSAHSSLVSSALGFQLLQFPNSKLVASRSPTHHFHSAAHASPLQLSSNFITLHSSTSMEPPDQNSRPPRKFRFAPNPPRRSARKLTTSITEEDRGDDSESHQSLQRKLSEHLASRRGRVEKKSPVQVAFSQGVASASIRSFGGQKKEVDDGSEKTNDESITDYSEAFASCEMQETQGVADMSLDLSDGAIVKKKKAYQEPWDYHHSYYPTTLPLRRPGSGDPDILNKQEFEEALENDGNTDSSASKFGLLDQDEKSRMLVFMFPPDLPLRRAPSNGSSKETDDSSKGKGVGVEELPEGYMGKMMVYKSGAVKLKLGDILYDVSSGGNSSTSQKVMAINVEGRKCCDLGEVDNKAVVTPDLDSLLHR